MRLGYPAYNPQPVGYQSPYNPQPQPHYQYPPPPQPQYNPPPQYPPQPHYPQYNPPPQYPPQPHYPAPSPYATQQNVPVFNEPTNFRRGPLLNYDSPISLTTAPLQYLVEQAPTTKHIHPLFRENAPNRDCKICRKYISSGYAYVCRECELILCYDCFVNIYHGKKFENIHPHPLLLRVRPSWMCDCCHRQFSGTASFYCEACDFDACSSCFIGY